MKTIFIQAAMAVLFLTGYAYAGNFTDNENGTVTDSGTGLMWQQEDDHASRTWKDALAYCEGLSFAGYSDWRLPKVTELQAIVDYAKYKPAIKTEYFPSALSSDYWSSTTYVRYTSNAWVVDFFSGSVENHNKADSIHYVRCLR